MVYQASMARIFDFVQICKKLSINVGNGYLIVTIQVVLKRKLHFLEKLRKCKLFWYAKSRYETVRIMSLYNDGASKTK